MTQEAIVAEMSRYVHRTLASFVLFLLFARPGIAQGNLNSPEFRCSALEIKPATQARYFAHHPEDVERAKCMLDFYARRLILSDLRPYRIALIRWVVTHYPGISLYLPQGLDVGTEATPDYSEIRSLWRKQVARRPGDAAILSNAGRALSIGDPEQALAWLKHALTLSPQDDTTQKRLAGLYADAIAGVSATGPELDITRVDMGEERSEFARRALQEAAEDSTIAAMTGMNLHYMSRWPFFRTRHLDYDKLAETLLLKAAALDYPQPSTISGLASFYFDQRSKVSGGVYPQASTVERPGSEVLKRLTTPEPLPNGSGRPLLSVRVKFIVGIDGHVQSASAIDPPTKQSGLMAVSKAESLSFLPLRIDGKPVQIATELTVEVERFGSNFE